MLYIDTFSKSQFTPEIIRVLSQMCQNFIDQIERISSSKIDRLSNYVLTPPKTTSAIHELGEHKSLIIHDDIDPPYTSKQISLNFDHADFVLV